MNNETEQNQEMSPKDEVQAMLKEIEQEIGTEEMNRRLEEAMQFYAEKNPDSVASKIMRIQKGNFEEMLMPAQYADFESAEKIAELLHNYYQNQGEDAFSPLLIEIGWCMMNDGAVLVPTIIRDGRLDMPLLSDDEENDWIPLFTSEEAAKAWPEEAEMRPIALEMTVLLATIRTGFQGIVLNPGTAEPMPLDRTMLEHLEKACNETRREESKEEQQNSETALLN